MAVAASPIDQWALDPAVVHLNHGSYGGCPRVVTEAAAALRARLEAAPMRFFVLEWQDELDRARAALARFVRAPDDRLVFTTNATTGVAIALNSIELSSGDEVLALADGYRAVHNQLARKLAGKIRRPVSFPQLVFPSRYDPDRIAEAILGFVTPNTRAAVLDHVTSPTGLVIPLERIVPELERRGVTVIVDGAHAPGQLPELDLEALGASYYAGNNHKWICAVKGTGFLYTRAGMPRPVVTSHGASADYGPPNRLHAELDWSGTHDPTPHLTVPVALAAIERMAGSWPAAMARNHALVIELRDRVIAGLGGTLAKHRTALDHGIGTMATIPIELPPGYATPLDLTKRLLADGWEVPIVAHDSGPLVRVSAHLYNEAGQADALAEKLRALDVSLRPIA